MDFGFILLIISAILGGIVVVLASVYAYVYHTQIRPGHRRKVDDEFRNPPMQQHQQEPETGRKRLFHPFMILAYASRWKRTHPPVDV